MTDAADKFFAAVHEYAFPGAAQADRAASPVDGIEAWRPGARAKLLEAVDEYSLKVHTFISGELRTLRAKARVCDAILASDVDLPCINDPKVQAAVNALREMEKSR